MSVAGKRDAIPHDQAMAAIVESLDESDVAVAALGTNVFALFTVQDRPLNYYTWGGMGLAGSIGLGIAMTAANRHVVVLDGDGAFLMNPNSATAIGRAQPANLLHVIMDNEGYSTTGGQPTGSSDVDLCGLAVALGYQWAERADGTQQLRALTAAFLRKERAGPGFIHVPVENVAGLSKPVPDPLYHKYRFMAALDSGGRGKPRIPE
jgi:thiamine pyrophosphate-dependent acetolactate synthase large subunit-like protein